MTLKRQLFLASLLMLVIPWAGLQFVLELDQALRAQAQEQLLGQARRMADVVAAELSGQPPLTELEHAIFMHRADRPIHLDGYGDEWPGFQDGNQSWQSLAGQPDIRWQAASHGGYSYLLINVRHPAPAYLDPGNPDKPHEFLRLRWRTDTLVTERIIHTPTQGQVVGRYPYNLSRRDHRVSGQWHTVSGGYQVELRLPRLSPGDQLGLEVAWPDPAQPGMYLTSGTQLDPIPLVTGRDPSLEARLATLLSPGQQVLVSEPAGWLIARDEAPMPDKGRSFGQLSPLEIIEQITLTGLRALVRVYQPEPRPFPTDRLQALEPGTGGLVQQDDRIHLMAVAATDDERRLVLTQSLDQILALSGNTLGSVIARSVLLIIGLMLVLLGYASWLSWRIARLQRAVNASVDPDGRILGRIPPSRAPDELGELNRHFGHMVDRLQGYTDYLESFSRRLSHELKTPVAVIRSSLDNLEHADNDKERAGYQSRARQATDRLSQILQGMSEAARLEQSFDQADREPFDLAEVLAEATAAYQSLDTDHRLAYEGPATECRMTGSPELMVQLLDKLVDNARDFTPAGGLVLVTLARSGDQLRLSVFNEGSSLPRDLTGEIFNPFVSVREGSGEGHLGQGLLIVRLIAEHHDGQVQASNQVHNGVPGVRFDVDLPAL
ncbi:ATP-binding protein [Marinobacter bryozoorum]|uniref:ATP-binding protein n=1 Tax=Marinobacter bryozoorum TaxID=256324 RepID=UPI00200485E4|nr:ATP-binding protein [Marinobacter bryozoorum]MCK7542636.1 ATP-binding protein [Marinobacter bryozoorum]